MKTVILAGGLGTRLAEETDSRPKPMVEIGGRPILWHIMNHYAHFGHREFFVALGYKGEFVKRYFVDYAGLVGSMSVALARGTVSSFERQVEDWTVHLMDTGLSTNTGGRIGRIGPWLSGERFMVTYGDGVSDVDLEKLIAFHEAHGKLVTMTAVRPPARFGALVFDGPLVQKFTEKPQVGEGWINGGFFVCEPGILDCLNGDDVSLEMHALVKLAAEGKLAAYQHDGFWQCMDTLRDKRLLEDLWVSGLAPWRMAA